MPIKGPPPARQPTTSKRVLVSISILFNPDWNRCSTRLELAPAQASQPLTRVRMPHSADGLDAYSPSQPSEECATMYLVRLLDLK
jgi:hypothetical protein